MDALPRMVSINVFLCNCDNCHKTMTLVWNFFYCYFTFDVTNVFDLTHKKHLVHESAGHRLESII